MASLPREYSVQGEVIALPRRGRSPGASASHQLALRDVRRFQTFLAARADSDWAARSEWRRLRIALNLRRFTLARGLAGLETAELDQAQAVVSALHNVDSMLAVVREEGETIVEQAAAVRMSDAIAALQQALSRLLAPTSVPAP
jgi:phage terminase Nu1 subunit (DNA packaging protein)